MRVRIGVLLVVGVAVAGCDGSGGAESCRDGGFLYDDESCGIADGGPPPCEQMGDLSYYILCDSDDDCCEPGRPHCSKLGLFNHGDYNCNATVRVCRSEQADDCPF